MFTSKITRVRFTKVMNNFRNFKYSFTLFLVMLLCISQISIVTNAATTSNLKLKDTPTDLVKALNKLKNIDQKIYTTEKPFTYDKKANIITVSQNGLKLKFNIFTKDIIISNSKGETTLKIPLFNKLDSLYLQDNKAIFSGKDSNVDVILEYVGGGFRQVLNLKNSKAPSVYDFEVKLEKSGKIIVNKDGSAAVKNAKGKTKLSIAKPWAIDAKNKKLKTWYTVDDNKLRQHIELKNAVFPVMADPLWCGDAASSVEWVYRDIYGGGAKWSLEVVPTTCAKWNSNPTSWSAWEEVISKTPDSDQWDKKYGTSQSWSMWNQYACHSDNVTAANAVEFLKGDYDEYRFSYHLEPWREDKGYWGFFKDGCN